MGVVTQRTTEYRYPVAPERYLSVTRKVRQVQRPFEGPRSLIYELEKYTLVKNVLVGNNVADYASAGAGWPTHSAYDLAFRQLNYRNDLALCYNKARAKCFEQSHGASADILALLAERKAASLMIFNRLSQMAAIADAVHGKSMSGIAKALRTNPAELRRRNPRISGLLSNPSATYLEVSWGWLPLLKDMMAAVSDLGRSIKPKRVSGASGLKYSSSWREPGQYYPVRQGGEDGSLRVKVSILLTADSVLRSEIARLGLSNPGASAWEVLSYSWLIDYFLNIGEIIQGWDDDLITKYEDGIVTRLVRGTDWNHTERAYPLPTNRNGFNAVRKCVMMNRQLFSNNLPNPFLTYNPSPFNLRRASYLVALLVTRLKGFQRFSNKYI